MKLLKNRKGVAAISVIAIIVACVTVAVGAAVGLAVVSQTETVFWNMELSSDANSSFDSTIETIYDSWPLMGLIVLALIAAAILMAIAVLR